MRYAFFWGFIFVCALVVAAKAETPTQKAVGSLADCATDVGWADALAGNPIDPHVVMDVCWERALVVKPIWAKDFDYDLEDPRQEHYLDLMLMGSMASSYRGGYRGYYLTMKYMEMRRNQDGISR